MTPIQLFPSDGTHKKSMITGGIALFLAYQVLTWGGDDGYIGASMIALFGLGLFGQVAIAKINPSPSFEADGDGFSVRGKKKRGWDEFRGTAIYTARLGIFPVAKWVVVKTGKTMLGGKTYIKSTHLSAPAVEMAREIEMYAQAAKQFAVLNVNAPQQAVQQAVKPAEQAMQQRPTTRPAPASAGQPKQAGTGPVQSVPTFKERMFGGRKVL